MFLAQDKVISARWFFSSASSVSTGNRLYQNKHVQPFFWRVPGVSWNSALITSFPSNYSLCEWMWGGCFCYNSPSDNSAEVKWLTVLVSLLFPKCLSSLLVDVHLSVCLSDYLPNESTWAFSLFQAVPIFLSDSLLSLMIMVILMKLQM